MQVADFTDLIRRDILEIVSSLAGVPSPLLALRVTAGSVRAPRALTHIARTYMHVCAHAYCTCTLHTCLHPWMYVTHTPV